MGTTFLRGSLFFSSNFLTSGASLIFGSTLVAASTAPTLTSALFATVPGRSALDRSGLCTSEMAGWLTPVCSLLVRLDLPPGVDFVLAIFGYSLYLYLNLWNELEAFTNQIQFAHNF